MHNDLEYFKYYIKSCIINVRVLTKSSTINHESVPCVESVVWSIDGPVNPVVSNLLTLSR